jgi:hypothetical protein
MDSITPHLTVIEMIPRRPLVDAVRSAFEDALAGKGNMDERVRQVDGFCGQKHRLFLNNLVAAVEKPNYLEIGIYRGATFCAAISNNKTRAVGVDNWSEYGGTANEFYANLALLKGPEALVTIIEQDFRTVDYKALGPFNIGFYDGSHSEKDQYDGARSVMEGFGAAGILMIDDWNASWVRRGTTQAMRDLDAHIDFAIEVRTSFDETMPTPAFGTSDWHNGVFAAVVSR